MGVCVWRLLSVVDKKSTVKNFPKVPYGSGLAKYGSGLAKYGSELAKYGSGCAKYGSGLAKYGQVSHLPFTLLRVFGSLQSLQVCGSPQPQIGKFQKNH
jgi:hypothetical protein